MRRLILLCGLIVAGVSVAMGQVSPGKSEAWFRVHYNSGGAGYAGKPRPVSKQARIIAPGTTRSMIVKEEFTSCRTVQVSWVRGGSLPE